MLMSNRSLSVAIAQVLYLNHWYKLMLPQFGFHSAEQERINTTVSLPTPRKPGAMLQVLIGSREY